MSPRAPGSKVLIKQEGSGPGLGPWWAVAHVRVHSGTQLSPKYHHQSGLCACWGRAGASGYVSGIPHPTQATYRHTLPCARAGPRPHALTPCTRSHTDTLTPGVSGAPPAVMTRDAAPLWGGGGCSPEPRPAACGGPAGCGPPAGDKEPCPEVTRRSQLLDSAAPNRRGAPEQRSLPPRLGGRGPQRCRGCPLSPAFCLRGSLRARA